MNQLFPSLAELFEDPDVMEIMIVGPDQVYVEKRGRYEDIPTPYRNLEHLMTEINQAATALGEPLGRPLSEQIPMQDYRLPDGSRLNIVLPPIAVNGPFVTIRRFNFPKLSLADLIEYGSWSQDMVTFLEACVQARLNIAIAGSNASGKTTVANIICGMIPDEERIIKIENATEMFFEKPRLLSLESRPADNEGKGEVTIQDLVINALRMRPDRIVVGEVRASEALDIIHAAHTGHQGTIFSIHAGGVRDVLNRLETMCTLHHISMPLLSVRDMIARAVQVVTFQERLPDGLRRMTRIAEVVGLQGDQIRTQDIFEFRQTGHEDGKITGYFTATGIVPTFVQKIRDAGVDIPMSLFTPT